jgi:hypothetical protein
MAGDRGRDSFILTLSVTIARLSLRREIRVFAAEMEETVVFKI